MLQPADQFPNLETTWLDGNVRLRIIQIFQTHLLWMCFPCLWQIQMNFYVSFPGQFSAEVPSQYLDKKTVVNFGWFVYFWQVSMIGFDIRQVGGIFQTEFQVIIRSIIYVMHHFYKLSFWIARNWCHISIKLNIYFHVDKQRQRFRPERCVSSQKFGKKWRGVGSSCTVGGRVTHSN
jgi:hypothetical protein